MQRNNDKKEDSVQLAFAVPADFDGKNENSF
jgi:hypothetical protein